MIDGWTLQCVTHAASTTAAAASVQGSWIKPGAVVIDVGTNPVNDASKKAGYRLVGDCELSSCREVAGAITPVPGGVGPMTIAMLLRNTATSAERFFVGECRCVRRAHALLCEWLAWLAATCLRPHQSTSHHQVLIVI